MEIRSLRRIYPLLRYRPHMNTPKYLKQEDIQNRNDILREKVTFTGKTVKIRRPITTNHTVLKGRLNEKFIKLMDDMSKFKTKRGDHIRARAYQKAQESLTMYPDEITHLNYTDLNKLSGIGETLTNKFHEYVTTGKLRALEREKSNPQNVFTDIFGVGAKAAQKLIDQGITTLDALREKSTDVLNDKQQIGLKYYDDILKRIPRAEIDVYSDIFEKTFDSVKSDDSKYEIVGSYRRGVTDSGDIDVIVTAESKTVFKSFMDKLIEQNIIIEVLSRGTTKSLVVTKMPNYSTARRVDFLYTSPEEYPFAVLYFTGSKNFNTVMRGRALAMGYSLNEHGMYKMTDKKKGDKVEHAFPDEESIFDFLKMEYKEPKNRIDQRSITDIGQPTVTILKKKTTNPKRVQTVKKRSVDKKAITLKNREDTQKAKEEKKMIALKKKEDAQKEKEEKKMIALKKKEDTQKEKEEKKRITLKNREGAKNAKTLKNREDAQKKKEDKKKVALKKKEDAQKEKEEKKMIALKKKEDARKEKEEKKARTLKNKENAKKQKTNVTIKKKTNKTKLKIISQTNLSELMPTTCPTCRININTNTKKYVLHAIQHFKEGGLSVLESLNEKTLNSMLKLTNEVYRNMGEQDAPLISDNLYDILEDYIKVKYPKNVVIGKIGAPVSKNKVTLPYEMASMDKIKPDTKALSVWKTKYTGPYVISCKLDGVSGLYTTEGDEPKLYTRGDGKVGQDISHLIPYLKLPTESGLVVRGEFIMAKSTFISKYASRFANGRNLVAGVVNSVTVRETVHDVDFVVYEVIIPDVKPSQQMEKIKSAGFITVRNESKTEVTNDELSKYLVDWRKNYDYEIDGIIVTNDNIYKRSSGNPDHSFAFKMVLSDQMAETKVLDVEWNASKDGYLKPRVRVEPIHLSGVKIEYATGFNGSFIEKNKIGVGAVIQIIRSGDVIPYIRDVIAPAEYPLMPSVSYIWNEKHVDVLLENKDDDETVRNKNIAGFFKGIDVDGLGEKNVVKMVDAGFDSVPKIIHMSKEDLLTVDGFKEKMAEKVHLGIKDKLDKASLSTIASVSNILGRGFSHKKLDVIMQEFPTVFSSSDDNDTKIKRITEIKGMSTKTAKPFVENIPAFLGFLKDCKLEAKLNLKPVSIVEIDETNPLFNKTIVMSGVRDKELESKLKTVGAKTSSSVTSNTFMVITPDVNSDTGKVVSAKKLSIPVKTPEQFVREYF